MSKWRSTWGTFGRRGNAGDWTTAAARAAGELEGRLTKDRLHATYATPANVPGGAFGVNMSAFLPASVAPWVAAHYAFLTTNARAVPANAAAPAEERRYWAVIGRYLAWMDGIAAGWGGGTVAGTRVTGYDVFVLNFQNEIGNVQVAVHLGDIRPPWERRRPQSPSAHGAAERKWMEFLSQQWRRSHCSALVKWAPGAGGDIFTSQVTWSSFSSMAFRCYKRYTIADGLPAGSGNGTDSGNGTAAGSVDVAFSSFPGTIASGDDWYITSKGLATQETTNEVFNTSLYRAVVNETVSEFLRVMVANTIASDGDDWTRIFAKHNSGTYNNQWMVVDYKRYDPAGANANSLAPGTMWVAEQIPGYVERADVTVVLEQQGYWGSYNWAYFKYIYDVSGYAEMKAEYGSFWSYTKYARPEIFKRNQSAVADLPAMQRLMRYNNFESDPLSRIPNCTGTPGGRCSPPNSAMLAIASRGDRNPPNAVSHYGPLAPYVGRIDNFGAIDAKIATRANMASLAGVALSGPTNDQQPTFAWSTSTFPQDKPAGSVDTYDFPWVQFG